MGIFGNTKDLQFGTCLQSNGELYASPETKERNTLFKLGRGFGK